MTITAPRVDRRRLAACATVTFVLGALWFLHRIGSGDLAAPPIADPTAFADWIDGRDPVAATFALLRLVGIGAGWYLVGTTTLQVAAGVTRLAGLGAVADVVSVPLARHLAAALLGLVTTVGSAGHDQAGPAGPVIERVADPTDAAVLRRLPDGEIMVEVTDDDSAVLRRLPDSDDLPAEAPQPPPRATTSTRHVVECGDHPWSISKDALADAWGRAPTDAEIDPFWRALLAMNPLPDPDLVFPGQVLTLPPAPPAP